MRNLQPRTVFFSLFFSLLASQTFFAQEKKTTVDESPEFEKLLNEKRRLNKNIAIKDGYKIQIYTGTSSECKKNLLDFKKDFAKYNGTIVYANPLYKVYIGPFKNRLQAEKTLEEIRDKYPSSLLIKP